MNKVILIGRLGADPETKTANTGTAIANFNLATNDRRKDGDQWVDVTDWHRIVAFGKTADTIGSYLRKGSECAIEGKIKTRKWQDKEGNDRYTTEVVCDRLYFVGSKSKDEEAPAGNNTRDSEPSGDTFEDDIPF